MTGSITVAVNKTTMNLHFYYLTYLLVTLGCFSHGFELRQATDQDVTAARKILFREAMNPFSLKSENMLVAVGDNKNLIGFGQIRPLDKNFSELASLFVEPEHRNKGIGGDIVKRLLENHKDVSRSKVCLLTLKRTSSFYERLGFEIASADERKKLPSSLQNEFLAGSAISLILGNDIICMIEK